MRKAQASLEQIVLSAGLLALVATVFVLSANYSADTTEISMAQDTVDQLTAAADFVYSLGPNSREYVTIYMPNNMVNYNITGKAVIIRIQTNGGITDISSYSNADLIGSLPPHSGTQRVLVEYLPSGVVRIGPGSLFCSPYAVSRGFTAGNNSNEDIIISNTGEYDITGINATISGAGGAFASVIGGTVPSMLEPGQNTTITINYDVPGSAESGVYGAMLTVGSEEGDSCFTQITLSVNNQPTCEEQCGMIGYDHGNCRASSSQCILNAEDYRPEKDFACDATPSTPSCCCAPTTDNQGPTASFTWLNSSNTSVLVYGLCDDTERGNGYISNAQMQINFGGWSQAYPFNGSSFSSSPVAEVYSNLNNIVIGTNIVGLRCVDMANNIGQVAYTSFNVNYTSNCTENVCSIEKFVAPIVNGIWQVPTPAYRLQPLIIYSNVSDTGNRPIQNCSIEADLSGIWQNMTPVDGAYDQPNETLMFNFTSGFDIGTHIISVHCTDSLNITGPNSYYFFNVTERDVAGPIVMNLSHTPYPTTMTNVDLTATATDMYTGNSNLQSCQIKVDSTSWIDIDAVEMPYDAPTENIIYNYGNMDTGIHDISYRCTDSQGNLGGVYNESFVIVDVDLMLVMDKSGSMDWNVTKSTSGNVVTAASTGWSWVKNLSVPAKNGDMANLTVEMMSNVGGCTTSYEARINDDVIATGSTTNTAYTRFTHEVDISQYDEQYQVALYLKRDASGCTAYARLMSMQQPPKKMIAAQYSAKEFLDISGSATYAGLVSYSTSAATNRQLAIMNPTNLQTLKDSIDAIVPTGSTCIRCGIVNAVNELISARGRAGATRVIVLLTDGVSNVGNSIDGAVFARENNVTIYAIGFGNDVDDTELTNVAMLTSGEYYYAPNAETLNEIFRNIGR